MPQKGDYECKNVYKNQDIETRKKALVKILADIINHQIKTKYS